MLGDDLGGGVILQGSRDDVTLRQTTPTQRHL